MEPYCRGYGLDIGFGGDPINDLTIRMDLPNPYAYTGDLPVQLSGDCCDLRWFQACVLDFVYSSHVLEDFDEHETEPLLREWTRVLQVGGFLILLLPDSDALRALLPGARGRHERASFHCTFLTAVCLRCCRAY